MYANLRALVRQLARSCSSRELEPRHAKERSLSDSLILTHRDELQKSHSARQLFKKSPSIAHAPIIQQLSAFGRSFNAFARKFLSFCGLFLRFILSAVAVDPQLPQEERPQRESFEHLAHVNSACLPLFRNAEHEALCTVKCFGMAGTRFRSAVWHLRSTIRMVIVDSAGPSDTKETWQSTRCGLSARPKDEGVSLGFPLQAHQFGPFDQSNVQLILFLGSFCHGFVGLLQAACGTESGGERWKVIEPVVVVPSICRTNRTIPMLEFGWDIKAVRKPANSDYVRRRGAF